MNSHEPRQRSTRKLNSACRVSMLGNGVFPLGLFCLLLSFQRRISRDSCKACSRSCSSSRRKRSGTALTRRGCAGTATTSSYSNERSSLSAHFPRNTSYDSFSLFFGFFSFFFLYFKLLVYISVLIFLEESQSRAKRKRKGTHACRGI